jgi:CBS domain-containing protein
MLVNPIAMPANAPVAAAARAMRDLDVGAVVVVEDERPLGVMTDRDTVVGIVSLDDLVGTADRSEG